MAKWRFDVIEKQEILDRVSSGNLHPVAAVATAQWIADAKAPDETSCELKFSCPACAATWNVEVAGIWVWMTDNSQRMGAYGCPGCGDCTVEVRATIPKETKPPTIHLMATVFAATKAAVIKPFRIEIVSMQSPSA